MGRAMRYGAAVCAALAAVAFGAPAAAGSLTGSEIRAAVTGARIVGENELESPYTVSFGEGGALKGVQGRKGQFKDHGRWWVEGDRLCVHWELWLFAKPTCYEVELYGDRITRIDHEGRDVIRSTLVR